MNVKKLDWSWGYCPEMFDGQGKENEKEWVIASYSHEWTWVPSEIRDIKFHLQQCNVFVGGGGRSECLADFESVLGHLNVAFKEINGYIF
ncbi:MAG: hypothetical protein WC375_00275 [Methanomassiliicoccales archaeon]|jgi:hypothetical protein